MLFRSRVLETIRKDVAADKVRVDNPTQNLESYFLDVVQKARKAAEATSGATSGHRVAEYLRGGAEEKASQEKMLERLTLPQAEMPSPVSVSQPAESIDQKKLVALTKQTTQAEPVKPAPAEQKPADLAKADEKLSSLLGKPK